MKRNYATHLKAFFVPRNERNVSTKQLMHQQVINQSLNYQFGPLTNLILESVSPKQEHKIALYFYSQSFK